MSILEEYQQADQLFFRSQFSCVCKLVFAFPLVSIVVELCIVLVKIKIYCSLNSCLHCLIFSSYHKHMIVFIFLIYAQRNGAKGPIFEDGPNFDLAFKLFHGKDGVLPLTRNSSSDVDKLEAHVVPKINRLASTTASISMSAFGPGGPFGFHSFFGKKLNKDSESSRKKEQSTKVFQLRHPTLLFHERCTPTTV